VGIFARQHDPADAALKHTFGSTARDVEYYCIHHRNRRIPALFSPVRALYRGGRLWRSEPIAIIGSISITVIAFAMVTLIRALPTGRDMRDFVGILDGAYKISQGL